MALEAASGTKSWSATVQGACEDVDSDGLIVALVAAGCAELASLPRRPGTCVFRRTRTAWALYETNLRGGVVYTEGSSSYLGVAAAAGGSETVTVLHSHRVALKGLAAGRYTIKSWLRPCDGNCGTLGGATDRCQLHNHPSSEPAHQLRRRRDPGSRLSDQCIARRLADAGEREGE